MNYTQAQRWVKREMSECNCKEVWVDTLDELSVRLQDEFGFSDMLAQSVCDSYWWAVQSLADEIKESVAKQSKAIDAIQAGR